MKIIIECTVTENRAGVRRTEQTLDGDDVSADEMISAFAGALMAMGYQPESVAAACELYAEDHPEQGGADHEENIHVEG